MKNDSHCPVPECGYSSNMRQFDEDVDRPLNLQSTRSNASEDAHRDMDGFDVDEELARLRRAVKEAGPDLPASEWPELYYFIVEAFATIDEHLLREGYLPRTWRSSACESCIMLGNEQAARREQKKTKKAAKKKSSKKS